MEVERDPEVNQDDLPNASGEDIPQVVAVANDDTKENNEASSTSSSSVQSSISSATERALQNSVILQNLFQLCPLSVVATCRLVSKQWYDESLTTWRSAFPLTVGMEKTTIFFAQRGKYYFSAKDNSPDQFTPLKEFLEFCGQPRHQCCSKPYRNIKIINCEFSLNPVGFDLFWSKIGRNLTTLNLSHCKFASIVEFREIIYKRCPVLRKLEINYGDLFIPNTSEREEETELEYKEPEYGEHKQLKTLSITFGGRREFPVSWMELFSHFSFLTSFELSKILAEEVELKTFTKVIKEVRKTDPRKLPFKRLQLYPHLVISRDPAFRRKYNFDMVKELHLPLSRCHIELHPELDQRFLRNTLDYLASSVDFIRILPEQNDNQPGQHPIPIWFLDFPFEIQMNKLSDVCENFTFLKYAPNLSTLFISEKQPPQGMQSFQSVTGSVANTSIEELANLKMKRLTTLRLEYIVSSNDLQHLINWMPNIMDLDMVLNNEQFGMVCQNWKSLRSLMVLGRELLTEVGIHPHIENASLEYLESLDLDINLTTEAVYHLFLHLPNLQKLAYYDRLKYGTVEREKLDISAYQRAIQDDVLEQWIADYGHILGE